MDYVIICLAALLGSALTFFSGFGLGTILLPLFSLFFPLDVAIALTAVVHFLNNVFKIALVGKHINKKVFLLFGLPSFVAAFAGAYVLTSLSHFEILYSYTIGNKEFLITALGVVISVLMIAFSIIELLPDLFKINNSTLPMISGGLLSGFFGGLSGHQGALRSVFLIKIGLNKESFVATGTAIAIIVDFARLSVYSSVFLISTASNNIQLISLAVIAAFVGAFTGNKLLKKVTIKIIQTIVAVMLIIFAILIGAGII